jgi:hypothetical protein
MARPGRPRQAVVREVAPGRPPVEEDSVPPVALTAATTTAPKLTPISIAPQVNPPAPAADVCGTARPPARIRLRLVPPAAEGTPAAEEEVHGRGGPASCFCRDCTMARHPAAMPRLSVVS